jgi:hypothetical protein
MPVSITMPAFEQQAFQDIAKVAILKCAVFISFSLIYFIIISVNNGI